MPTETAYTKMRDERDEYRALLEELMESTNDLMIAPMSDTLSGRINAALDKGEATDPLWTEPVAAPPAEAEEEEADLVFNALDKGEAKDGEPQRCDLCRYHKQCDREPEAGGWCGEWTSPKEPAAPVSPDCETCKHRGRASWTAWCLTVRKAPCPRHEPTPTDEPPVECAECAKRETRMEAMGEEYEVQHSECSTLTHGFQQSEAECKRLREGWTAAVKTMNNAWVECKQLRNELANAQRANDHLNEQLKAKEINAEPAPSTFNLDGLWFISSGP